MELDSEWLTNLEQEDQKYAEFYKESTEHIEIFCLYVNQKNDLKFGHKQSFNINNKLLSKKALIELVKQNVEYNSIKYKPFSIIKYNFTLDPAEIKNYLDNPLEYDFLSIENIDDIKFDDTIGIFKDLNSLYILYYEPHKLQNTNKTKKIYINNRKTKRKRQTKRKQLKA